MKIIPLTQGKVALVDDGDYEKVADKKWYAARYGNLWYAQREERVSPDQTRCIKLHQIILSPKEGYDTDHKNGEGLDCRRKNLRYAREIQNGQNKRKPLRVAGTTSQYKGVCWAKDRHKWRAAIRVNWKLINLGGFDNEEQAARVYDAAAVKYFANFAQLNFPT